MRPFERGEYYVIENYSDINNKYIEKITKEYHYIKTNHNISNKFIVNLYQMYNVYTLIYKNNNILNKKDIHNKNMFLLILINKNKNINKHFNILLEYNKIYDKNIDKEDNTTLDEELTKTRKTSS